MGNPFMILFRELLIGLCTVPFVGLLIYVMILKREGELGRVISKVLWPKIYSEYRRHLILRKLLMILLALALMWIALSRPQWGGHEETLYSNGSDVMVVLDVSRSMEVEDIQPNRLEKSKHWIRTLMSQLPTDRIGLVAFAGGAYCAVPLTSDHDYVDQTLSQLSPYTVTYQGTDIGLGLEVAVKALSRGAENGQPHTQSIILITDGEDLEGKALEMAKVIREHSINLAVIGVGTEAGGKIPVKNENGQIVGYKRDGDGQQITSTFHSETLTRLAEQSGGSYWALSMGENEIDTLARQFGLIQKTQQLERKILVKDEMYWLPLTLALIVLLVSLWVSIKNHKVGLMVVLLFFSGPLVVSTQAGVLNQELNQIGQYGFQKKAVIEYQLKKPEKAFETYLNGQVKYSDCPSFAYNLSVLLAQKEDWLQASQMARLGIRLNHEQPMSTELSLETLYNEGVYQTQLKNIPEALKAYQLALKDKTLPGHPELEHSIRKNIEYLFQQSQQQSQSGKGESQDGQGQSSDQQNNQNSQNNQADQNPEKSDSPEKTQNEKRQNEQAFKSQKYSPQDAEKIMKELSEREQQLSERLKQQRGKQAPSGKDW
jgi:Ca-activated chloride channel family protein